MERGKKRGFEGKNPCTCLHTHIWIRLKLVLGLGLSWLYIAACWIGSLDYFYLQIILKFDLSSIPN